MCIMVPVTLVFRELVAIAWLLHVLRMLHAECGTIIMALESNSTTHHYYMKSP